MSFPESIRGALLTGLLAVALALVLAACQSLNVSSDERSASLVDPDATSRTRALFAALRDADGRVLFGHQDALAYGVEWIAEDASGDRSDVKSVAGSHPAVYGWDVGDIGNPGAAVNLDSVPFARMKRWMVKGYERGGVVTVSWHMDNPMTGGDSWDTTGAVGKLLPDSSHHRAFRRKLDRFAAFVNGLDAGFWSWAGLGHDVPVVFRPFHEMNGHWFWWGEARPAVYKRLWRFTVRYLRDTKGVDNLLYAYSPDVFGSREDYLRYYPGDAYVDVLGYDDYYSLARYDRLARIDTVAATAPETDAVVRWAGPDTLASGAAAPDSVGLDSVYVDPARADSLAAASLAGRLGVVVREARRRGKVAAFTETGYEGIPDSTWWTDRLLPALNADPQTRQIAWVLVWRNANRQRKPGHHYAPYPKHGSAADFRRFAASPLIFLQDEVPGLYD